MSIDADLIEGIARAVAGGRAKNASAWVSEAIRAKVEHEARLAALDAFFVEYEREHGAISDAEAEHALQRLRARSAAARAARRKNAKRSKAA